MLSGEEIKILAESIRGAIGDIPRQKLEFGVVVGFVRTIEGLVRVDPTLPGRARALARERASSLLHQEDMADAALNDPGDPTHYLWILTCRESQVRAFARRKATEGEGLPKILAGIIGLPPGFPQAEEHDEP